MRVSHKKKFVFLSNPKSGSESIRQILYDESDLLVDKESYFEDFSATCSAGINHKCLSPHSPAVIVKAFFKYKNWPWEEYYKFTTIRNPWDKLVSAYHYGRPDVSYKYFWEEGYEPKDGLSDFKEWVFNAGIYFYPITYFAFDGETCLIDNIIKIEEISILLPKLLSRFGIEINEVPVINQGIRKYYAEYYDEDTVEIVRDKFSIDIEIGGYSF